MSEYNPLNPHPYPFHVEWVAHLSRLQQLGEPIGPRGLGTRELLDQHIVIDSRASLLHVPERGLNYRFAVAEWLWMMFGRSDVESLAQYNSKMRRFSDDGVFLAGAYGPHLGAQRDAMLAQLRRDPDTRQAVLEIARPRDRYTTKDNPCTLSLQFLRRDGALHLIATMRSSDAWLGVPYDVFTFTQIQNCYAGALSVKRGWFSLRMGSAHLYDSNLQDADRVLKAWSKIDHGMSTIAMPDLPDLPPAWLEDVLVKRDSRCIVDQPASAPWLPYAHALLGPSNAFARDALLFDVSSRDVRGVGIV